MENKTENLDSLNEEKVALEEEIKTLDSENDKEKISEINEKINSLNDEIKVLDEQEDDDIDSLKETNKRLFARAKKAEGFVQEGDKWIKKPKVAPKTETKTFTPPKDSNDIDSILEAKLEKRDLDALDLSDELKKEVSTYAKVQGISVKKALSSSYITFLKEKEEKKEKIDNASLGSKRKATKKDYSEMTASDFDLKTPDGKADFAKFEEHIRTELG